MALSFFLLISFVTGLAGAWGVAEYGHRLKIMDTPNHRSSHSKAVPKGGGIGIVLSFVCLSVIFKLSFLFWVPAVIVAIISFAGDRKDLPVSLRLLIQMICAFCFVMIFSHRFEFYSILIICLCIVFITGTANIFNFMDGIDGIAGISAIVSFGSLAAYGYLMNIERIYILISSGLALSCLGFLIFNFPKARVFMGDVGSVFLGFLFAGITVLLSSDLQSFICMVSFLSLFYIDSISTMVVRFARKESLVKPHRRHLYQLLTNDLGMSHWKISLGFGTVQAVANILMLFFRQSLPGVIMIQGAFIIVFIMVTTIVRQKVI